jgi:hypothetical protein
VQFILSVWLADGTVGSHLAAASPQVGWPEATMAAVPGTVCLGFVVTLALIVIVVGPAVWSKRAYRRKAAQTVLDKILQALIRVLRIWRR